LDCVCAPLLRHRRNNRFITPTFRTMWEAQRKDARGADQNGDRRPLPKVRSIPKELRKQLSKVGVAAHCARRRRRVRGQRDRICRPDARAHAAIHAAIHSCGHSAAQVISFKDLHIYDDLGDASAGGDGSLPLLESANSYESTGSDCASRAGPNSVVRRAGIQKNKLIIIMVGLPGRGKTFL
jgi:hypothetical protein